MNFGDRIFGFLLYVTGIVFVAGAVHLVSILLMPQVAPHDAYARLSRLAKPGQMVLLPPALPGHEITPFEDPAMAQAVCLYDVSSAPLHLHAEIPDAGLLTLSFRTRSGKIFYSMTDQAALHGTIDVRIMTEPQLEAIEDSEDDENEPLQELRLVAPDVKGFVLVNALAAFPSERAAAEARATSVSCSTEAIAQQ
ncbi:MAG TPA: hypothetical protein VKV77_03115 [Methylovirgula sp.]|nr:hypothetical protein [Methylovirgula sp.]